jgi:hypothetical protein
MNDLNFATTMSNPEVQLYKAVPASVSSDLACDESATDEMEDRSPPILLPSESGLEAEAVAAEEATKVVQGLRDGVEAVIAACATAHATVERFKGNRAAVDQFVRVLADENVLSKAEARVGADSPKLSKLRKVGQYARTLQRTEVLAYLQPGYTILYQVALLYETLEGDEESRTNRLVQLLRACDGELTREYLSSATKDVKRAQKRAQADELTVEEDGPGSDEDAHSSTDEKHIEQYDLLLLTPSRRDIQGLQRDYADHRDLPRCLRLHEKISERAAVVVTADLTDLPIIAGKLLPCCGFKRISRVFLTHPPKNAEVTNAKIVIAAERGSKEPILAGFDIWSADPGEIVPNLLATQLHAAADKKLHAFASEPSEGWASIIGDSNWEMQSLS